MVKYTTYRLSVAVFHETYMHQSAQGEITLFDENGKTIESKKFNDWVEIGYWIRQLLYKHKKIIDIIDSKHKKIGEKSTRLKKSSKGV